MRGVSTAEGRRWRFGLGWVLLKKKYTLSNMERWLEKMKPNRSDLWQPTAEARQNKQTNKQTRTLANVSATNTRWINDICLPSPLSFLLPFFFFRPRRDLNSQSPASETGALSIRPHGQKQARKERKERRRRVSLSPMAVDADVDDARCSWLLYLSFFSCS